MRSQHDVCLGPCVPSCDVAMKDSAESCSVKSLGATLVRVAVVDIEVPHMEPAREPNGT